MTAADPDRRRFLASLGGLAVLTGVARAGYGLFSKGASLPALVVPPGVGPLETTRLQKLHLRYDKAFVAGGATALRSTVGSDLLSFRTVPKWQELIVEWIRIAGWSYSADQLLDAALLGSTDLRRTCSVCLAEIPTPLVTAAVHGARVVALHKAETDPMAATAWRDLRRRLGV